MGEIAEAMLSGLFCEGCGTVFDDFEEPGLPRRCEACEPTQETRSESKRMTNKEKRRRWWRRHQARQRRTASEKNT
jgi:hypothetical protein